MNLKELIRISNTHFNLKVVFLLHLHYFEGITNVHTFAP